MGKVSKNRGKRRRNGGTQFSVIESKGGKTALRESSPSSDRKRAAIYDLTTVGKTALSATRA